MYSLRYYTKDGRIIETVLCNAPYGVCKWKAKELSWSSHQDGIFKIERI